MLYRLLQVTGQLEHSFWLVPHLVMGAAHVPAVQELTNCMIYVFNENCVFFMICYLLVACGKKKGSGEEVGGGLDKFNHIHSYPTQLWPTWKHLQALTNLDFLIREVEVTSFGKWVVDFPNILRWVRLAGVRLSLAADIPAWLQIEHHSQNGPNNRPIFMGARQNLALQGPRWG